jgi:hypothetical protein
MAYRCRFFLQIKIALSSLMHACRCMMHASMCMSACVCNFPFFGAWRWLSPNVPSFGARTLTIQLHLRCAVCDPLIPHTVPYTGISHRCWTDTVCHGLHELALDDCSVSFGDRGAACRRMGPASMMYIMYDSKSPYSIHVCYRMA